jgi:hypothetical protein
VRLQNLGVRRTAGKILVLTRVGPVVVRLEYALSIRAWADESNA